jgi:pimeloyl-ACP methyl ester carboxylesterase
VADRVAGGAVTPLVYLHGITGVSDDDPIVTALTAAGHEVFAPLSPGFADLDELEDLRDVHELALHYDDLLEERGLDAVALVGHSFGAMVAAELAAHVPTRVSKLVLAAPFGLWRDDQPTADVFTAFPTEIQDLLWANPPDELDSDPVVSMLIAMVQGLTTVGKFIWPIPDKGLERRLHRIKADTLLVWGTKDKVVPASHAKLFAAKIPRCRVELLDDAGHMAPFERVDEFVELVGGHIR